MLEKYNNSEKQIINVFNGDGDNRSFNILAVILFLINDYFEYGIYTNSEDIVEVNGDGEILWGKTIDESFAIIEDNKPYYMDLYTGKNVEDDRDYFKRLHECVITECSRQLKNSQLDVLFDIDTVELSEETLLDFGDTDYILERLYKELNVQFNTRRQILLKTIYTYISQDKRMLEENDGISMFGTTAYHAVWENVCAEVFDNKLKTTLGQLKMSVPLAKSFSEKSKDTFMQCTAIGRYCHVRQGINITAEGAKCMSESEMKLFDDGKKPMKKFVRYKEGAKLYSMSQNHFEMLAKEANAVYQRGRLVLVNVRIMDEYLEQFHVRN